MADPPFGQEPKPDLRSLHDLPRLPKPRPVQVGGGLARQVYQLLEDADVRPLEGTGCAVGGCLQGPKGVLRIGSEVADGWRAYIIDKVPQTAM